jgi:hypothetical protein
MEGDPIVLIRLRTYSSSFGSGMENRSVYQ